MRDKLTAIGIVCLILTGILALPWFLMAFVKSAQLAEHFLLGGR